MDVVQSRVPSIAGTSSLSIAQPIFASGYPSRSMVKIGNVWMTSPRALKRTSNIFLGGLADKLMNRQLCPGPNNSTT